TDWITDFDKNKQGEEIISEAINQSVKEKAKSFSYLNNKLKRYVDANVKTLDDAKAQSKTNGRHKKKKEVNDWLSQMIGE
ncbi:MAG: DnaD domain protein, partial [Staphylococcus equorum]|nr:DnaD domain protein [Staphylococcus equorum]